MTTATETNQTLKDVPIFAVGDYESKGRYGAAELYELAKSFDPNYLEAPVTLDHNEFGRAYGWVTKLRADNQTLYADLELHPDIYEDVKQGRYRYRSVEFYRQHKFPDGRTGLLLKAVSLLGAASPHCKSLGRIQFAFREPSIQIAFSEKGNPMQTATPTVDEIRVEQLAERLMQQTRLTKAEAVEMAQSEINRCPASPEAENKAELYHERRKEIAAKVESLMQANPNRDYFEACREAERVVLS